MQVYLGFGKAICSTQKGTMECFSVGSKIASFFFLVDDTVALLLLPSTFHNFLRTRDGNLEVLQLECARLLLAAIADEKN